MAKGNLQRCLEHLWPHEGGYVDHPRDPGGATNMGITLATLRKWRGKPITKADVRNLTKAEAADIYAAKYWRPIRGDELPMGVDLSAMDYGVNSGPSRSARDLQRVLGVTVDGVVGPATVLAAQTASAPATIKAHCARRLGFVQGLKIWDTFGKGWSRRIAAVEATALSWVLSPAELAKEAKAARDKAAGQGASGGAVVSGGAADQLTGASGLPLGVVLGVALLVGGAFVIRSIINSQRAAALSTAAKGTS